MTSSFQLLFCMTLQPSSINSNAHSIRVQHAHSNHLVVVQSIVAKMLSFENPFLQYNIKIFDMINL